MRAASHHVAGKAGNLPRCFRGTAGLMMACWRAIPRASPSLLLLCEFARQPFASCHVPVNSDTPQLVGQDIILASTRKKLFHGLDQAFTFIVPRRRSSFVYHGQA